MRKGIILIGLMVILLSSCNNSRIAELEAENTELKATVERLTAEAKQNLVVAQEATVAARIAERELRIALEAAKKSREL